MAVDLDWNETGDDEAVIEPVIQALSEEEIETIYQFEEILSEKLFSFDTKAHGKRHKHHFSQIIFLLIISYIGDVLLLRTGKKYTQERWKNTSISERYRFRTFTFNC